MVVTENLGTLVTVSSTFYRVDLLEGEEVPVFLSRILHFAES